MMLLDAMSKSDWKPFVLPVALLHLARGSESELRFLCQALRVLSGESNRIPWLRPSTAAFLELEH